MLKYRKQIDILERYCGKYAELFQWLVPGGSNGKGGEYYVRALIYSGCHSFKVDILLNMAKGEDSHISLKFYPTKTGGGCILETTSIKNPQGPKRIEDRIGLLIETLTPNRDPL